MECPPYQNQTPKLSEFPRNHFAVFPLPNPSLPFMAGKGFGHNRKFIEETFPNLPGKKRDTFQGGGFFSKK